MPKIIPITDMRNWLDSYEQGKSEAAIARAAKRDIRTIKRGIEHARRERDGQVARAELLKDALRKHQDDLMGVVEGILLALELPPLDLSLPWKIRDGSAIRLSGATAQYRALQHNWTVVFQRESYTLWELLMDHMKRDPVLKCLNRWKKATEEHITARIGLNEKTAKLLEQKTGLKLVERAPGQGSYLDLHVAAPIIYGIIFRRALGIRGDIDPENDIVSDVKNGTVTCRNARVAAAPGAEAECRQKILEAIEGLKTSGEANRVAVSYRQMEVATVEARKVVEEINLMGLIPGQCSVCKRMGIFM